MAKFNIDAKLHRVIKGSDRKKEVWTRRYARIETALRKAVEIMIMDGQSGDVLEFYVRKSGYQIATVRMSARGKLDIQWNDQRAKLIRFADVM